MAFSAPERFTLYDADGVFLSAGEEMDIREPVWFNEFLRVVERDDEYFGYNAEFGEGESELSFSWNKAPSELYSAHEMLQSIFLSTGGDASVMLRYYRTDTAGTETLQYEWGLILFSGEEEDDLFTCRVKKIDFGDKLITRFDTDADLESSVDMDDNVNSALTLDTIPLHSRLLIIETILESPTAKSVESSIGYSTLVTNVSIVILLPFEFNGGGLNLNVNEDGAIQSAIVNDTNYLYVVETVDDVGEYNIGINTDFDFSDQISSLGDEVDDVVLSIKLLILDQDNNTIEDVEMYTNTIISTPTVVTEITDSASVSYNETHQLEFGYKVFIYAEFSFVRDNSISRTHNYSFSLSIGDTLTIRHNSLYNPSTTQGAFIFEALKKAIEKAVGLSGFDITLTSISGSFSTGEIIYSKVFPFVSGTAGTFVVGETITSPTFTGVIDSLSYVFGSLSQIGIIPGTGTLSEGQTLTGQTSGATTNISASIVDLNYIRALVISWSSPVLTVEIIEGNPTNGFVVYGTTSSAEGEISSSELSSDILESDFLSRIENGTASDGYGSLNFITSGKKVRGLSVNSNLKTSVGKLIDFLRCRYACGWMIINDGGTKKVKVEPSYYFFQSVKILTLTNVKSPVRRKLNVDLLYNEVELGFKKYAKENEDSSISGFATKKTYLLPIEKEKKKLRIIAPVVADSAEIERIRRLNIRQDESDQSDDEVIIVKCVRIGPSGETFSIFQYGITITVDDANDTITINGLYLEGQLSSITEINLQVISGLSTWIQTITVDVISSDRENNTVTITTSEAIDAPDNTYVIGFFTFDVDIFIPQRLEGFSNITGVDDSKSEYNLDHAPSNFLVQWWHLIGSTLTQKADTKKVKFVNGVNNVALSKRYLSSDGPLTTSTIAENQDFLLSSLNVYNPGIMKPFEWELSCHLSYDNFMILRNALLGQDESSPSLNFGYVEFTDNFGTLVGIWVKSMKREEDTGRVDIIGWERNTETPPPPPTHYILTEDGDRILNEDGSYMLQETAIS